MSHVNLVTSTTLLTSPVVTPSLYAAMPIEFRAEPVRVKTPVLASYVCPVAAIDAVGAVASILTAVRPFVGEVLKISVISSDNLLPETSKTLTLESAWIAKVSESVTS